MRAIYAHCLVLNYPSVTTARCQWLIVTIFSSAFADFQTDMTDLTSDLVGVGMPFVSHREFATKMLFTGQDIVPETVDEEVSKQNFSLRIHYCLLLKFSICFARFRSICNL